MLEFASLQENVDSEEIILRIIGFIAHFLFLIYMRDNLMKLEAYYDERTTSHSDYTVMMKNIPKREHSRANLQNFFNTAYDRPHEIKNMVIIPEHREAEAKEAKKR